MRRLILVIAIAFAACGRPPAPQPGAGAGRSGFWTSRQPASGNAYRYRLMGIGGAIVLVMGFVTLRLVKRAKQSRELAARRDHKPR